MSSLAESSELADSYDSEAAALFDHKKEETEQEMELEELESDSS
jgi:hypothetical protein